MSRVGQSTCAMEQLPTDPERRTEMATRRGLIVATCVLLGPAAAKAQSHASNAPPAPAPSVMWGGLLGVNGATFSDPNQVAEGIAISSKVASIEEIFLQVPLGQNLYLQPGIAAGWRGAWVASVNDQARVDLGYVDFPVLLGTTLGSGRVRPFIQAGPVFSLLSECKVVSDSLGTVPCGSPSPYRSSDFGLDGGAGIEWLSQNGQALGIQAQYTLGLRNISSGGGQVSNRSYSISAVYKLPFGHRPQAKPAKQP